MEKIPLCGRNEHNTDLKCWGARRPCAIYRADSPAPPQRPPAAWPRLSTPHRTPRGAREPSICGGTPRGRCALGPGTGGSRVGRVCCGTMEDTENSLK